MFMVYTGWSSWSKFLHSPGLPCVLLKLFLFFYYQDNINTQLDGAYEQWIGNKHCICGASKGIFRDTVWGDWIKLFWAKSREQLKGQAIFFTYNSN